MGRREIIDSVLSRVSYRVNSTKMVLEINHDEKPLVIINLNNIKGMIDSLFGQEKTEPRIQQVANVFLELYKKRYPSVKKGFKDFDKKDQNHFQQIVDIIDGFNKKYPEFKLNYRRYLNVHFAFYKNNFNTAPKPSFFVTDNAVRRTDEAIQFFEEKWPGDQELDSYFANNISKASPKSKAEEKSQEPTQDIRLTGLQIWTTNDDKDTPLRDNSRFQALKARVLKGTASIYEARYVRDCYHARNSVDTMPGEVGDYIQDLEDLAQKLNVKLR